MIATFAKLRARLSASKERREASLLALVYDPAPSASQLPESALKTRQGLIQRRVARKSGNTKAKELSTYSETHRLMMEQLSK